MREYTCVLSNTSNHTCNIFGLTGTDFHPIGYSLVSPSISDLNAARRRTGEILRTA